MATLLAWLATAGFCHWLPRLGRIDVPNTRLLPSQPAPRSGGLSFVLVATIMTIAAVVWPGMPVPSDVMLLPFGGAVREIALLDGASMRCKDMNPPGLINVFVRYEYRGRATTCRRIAAQTPHEVLVAALSAPPATRRGQSRPSHSDGERTWLFW
jgi:hypothetical protein